MRELEALLKYRDTEFSHLNNRVRCFPHIINICASHIIASCTRVSKEYLKLLRSQGDGDDDDDDDSDDDDVVDDDDDNDDNDNDNDSDNNNDNDNDNDNDNSYTNIPLPRGIRLDIPQLKLKTLKLDGLSAEERAWFAGMRRDPVKRARTVVRILRSSDQRKQGFKEVIKSGNQSGWFKRVDGSVIVVKDLEPLRDVKTRWDSTFAMIERLLMLRPVSTRCYNRV